MKSTTPNTETRDRLRRTLAANAAALSRSGAIAAGIAGGLIQLALFAGPLVAWTGPLIVGAVVLLHAIALRVGLVTPVDRAWPGRGYDRVRRWLLRLGYVTIAPWGYGLMLTPVVGLLAGPVASFILTALVHQYLRWSSDREADGQGPHPIEKALVLIFAAAVLFALFALVVLGAASAWLATWIAEMVADG